jgi:hypothetical protein
MSRGGTQLFGGGTLDELALYNTSLNATTVLEHRNAAGP